MTKKEVSTEKYLIWYEYYDPKVKKPDTDPYDFWLVVVEQALRRIDRKLGHSRYVLYFESEELEGEHPYLPRGRLHCYIELEKEAT